ncbi:MAG: hypothetical protein COV34_01105 [Candidatus Zambryskibacteria bacterium CG10_big_fil_rev_8_21_14_0_10_42_12]|uniref:Lipid II flippase MurJ n=1 Tax=Candidatus Zambryskibacteria bacterium CG10_big_fil_rev_8_21_14_0_10_42_12 TaxID=1975115 RepID=A0A2H0QV85_9BACT|nr:MAG: hypothetical protein COV34_01105 [Candidatus Zambryskibacteria bacterium CG10_big_fil_rev_8_21_14_0_10_42_12]
MVERIGKLFASKVSSLHTAAYIMGAFTIVSSLLALVRDRLLASSFGAGSELDMYYAAFRIPDLLFVSVGSLVSVSVLIPLLAKREKEAVDGGEAFELSKATTFFAVIISVSSVLLFVVLPYVVPVVFIGFDMELQGEVVRLSRWLLLSPIILGFSNVFGSVTQLQNRFVLYALSPVLYNVGIIIGIIFLAPLSGITGVVYGVIIGALLHLLPQALYVYKVKLWPRIVRISWVYAKSLAALSASRTIALSLSHLVLLLLVAIASSLAAGTIAVFTFSYNLQSVFVGVIGVSYSLAAFSALSKLVADNDWDEYKRELTSSFRQLLFWSIPAAVLLIILRAQIVRTVLGGGMFSWADTRLTAAALAIFAIATIFQSASLLFTRAFYAQGETKKPLIAHVTGSGIAIILGVLFLRMSPEGFLETMSYLLKITDLDPHVLLLPTAFAIGSLVTVILLAIPLFVKKLVGVSLRFVAEVVGGSLTMGAVAYIGLIIFEPLLGTDTLVGIFSQGLFAGLLGIMSGIGFLWVIGNTDVRDAIFFLTPKREKVDLPATDVSEMAP